MQRRVLLVFILIVFLTAFPGFASASDDTFTVKVQATGHVRVPPTKAQMWIGAKTDGNTAKEALNSSNEVVQELIDVFSQFTSPELVKTSEFNMYQRERWDDETQQSIPEGFAVRHVFEVQILDLTHVANFLDLLTQAGANIIYGLQYGIQDYRAPREEAFKQAMEEAWWKAGILAEANSAENLVLENVEETQFYGTDYGNEAIALESELGDSFMPGQLQVSVSVVATFRAQTPQ